MGLHLLKHFQGQCLIFLYTWARLWEDLEERSFVGLVYLPRKSHMLLFDMQGNTPNYWILSILD